MKTMFCAFAAIVLIGVAAPLILRTAGFGAAQATAGPDVRLGGAGPEDRSED